MKALVEKGELATKGRWEAFLDLASAFGYPIGLSGLPGKPLATCALKLCVYNNT
jgi:hypothetical protein